MVRLLSLLMIIMICSTSKASEFRLFNHQSAQYKKWMLATNRLHIARSAEHVGIPKHILLAVCFAESSHRNIGAIPDGNTDSIGICQVKLETAQFVQRYFNVKKIVTIKDLNSVGTNSFYAALYLLYQYRRYGNWSMAIDAYNRGSNPNPKSRYVSRVLAYTEGSK